MVTPFGADGAFDEDAAARLMHYLLEHGSDGLVLAGSTGESSTLTDAEKLRLWELGVAESGDALVVAGTGTYDTRHSVELTERATELGVDAMLVVTPYYNKPNRRGIVAHFQAVAAATDKPVIAYNIPSRCVIDMPNDLLAELAQIDNVERRQAGQLTRTSRRSTAWTSTPATTTCSADVLDMGGTGGILVASHLVGDEMRRMIDEPDNRRRRSTRRCATSIEALSVTANPIPIKAALDLAGHASAGCGCRWSRPPRRSSP